MQKPAPKISVPAYTRMQIYLSAAQLQALGQLSKTHQISKSELIRRAVDWWIEKQSLLIGQENQEKDQA